MRLGFRACPQQSKPPNCGSFSNVYFPRANAKLNPRTGTVLGTRLKRNQPGSAKARNLERRNVPERGTLKLKTQDA